MPSSTVLFNQTSILRHHIYQATALGANFNELCRRMKITPEQLEQGEEPFPWEPGEETDFWTHALELTGDPALGLHMGQHPSNNSLGMLGLLLMSCRTMRQAMEMMCQYNQTLTNVFTYSFELSGNQGLFHFNPHPLWESSNPESARQAVDATISGWIKGIHQATGKHIYPVQTNLRFSRRLVAEYQKIIPTPILFDQPSSCFIFSMADLDTPLLSYDATLLPVFQTLLQQKLESLSTRDTIRNQVKTILLSDFKGQLVHIDIVASKLHLTARTLQRKLADEGTSYRQLSTELRKDLANTLLRSNKTKKSEIGFLLGYADLSTFSKALKNWER